mmetsp:Transcript_41983/g.98472  ORF Transcript_41983/g.98472 Transcript_41983/m.98472 type:complete len:280 (-) Transcript_41983:3594-4433(-)
MSDLARFSATGTMCSSLPNTVGNDSPISAVHSSFTCGPGTPHALNAAVKSSCETYSDAIPAPPSAPTSFGHLGPSASRSSLYSGDTSCSCEPVRCRPSGLVCAAPVWPAVGFSTGSSSSSAASCRVFSLPPPSDGTVVMGIEAGGLGAGGPGAGAAAALVVSAGGASATLAPLERTPFRRSHRTTQQQIRRSTPMTAHTMMMSVIESLSSSSTSCGPGVGSPPPSPAVPLAPSTVGALAIATVTFMPSAWSAASSLPSAWTAARLAAMALPSASETSKR